MRLIRKEFVTEETICGRLSTDGRTHGFPSKKAWIIDIGGEEKPYGPDCAEILLGKDAFREGLLVAPDLTTRDFIPPAEVHSEGGNRGGGGAPRRDPGAYTFAAAYLELRFNILATVPGIAPGVSSYPALALIYDAYRNGSALTDADVASIHRIEAAARTKAPTYSCVNLMDVYTAHYNLSALLRKIPEGTFRNFVISVHRQLLSRLRLTDKQVAKCKLRMLDDAFSF